MLSGNNLQKDPSSSSSAYPASPVHSEAPPSPSYSEQNLTSQSSPAQAPPKSKVVGGLSDGSEVVPQPSGDHSLEKDKLPKSDAVIPQLRQLLEGGSHQVFLFHPRSQLLSFDNLRSSRVAFAFLQVFASASHENWRDIDGQVMTRHIYPLDYTRDRCSVSLTFTDISDVRCKGLKDWFTQHNIIIPCLFITSDFNAKYNNNRVAARPALTFHTSGCRSATQE